MGGSWLGARRARVPPMLPCSVITRKSQHMERQQPPAGQAPAGRERKPPDLSEEGEGLGASQCKS